MQCLPITSQKMGGNPPHPVSVIFAGRSRQLPRMSLIPSSIINSQPSQYRKRKSGQEWHNWIVTTKGLSRPREYDDYKLANHEIDPDHPLDHPDWTPNSRLSLSRTSRHSAHFLFLHEGCFSCLAILLYLSSSRWFSGTIELSFSVVCAMLLDGGVSGPFLEVSRHFDTKRTFYSQW